MTYLILCLNTVYCDILFMVVQKKAESYNILAVLIRQIFSCILFYQISL